jgi:hypothetical protein
MDSMAVLHGVESIVDVDGGGGWWMVKSLIWAYPSPRDWEYCFAWGQSAVDKVDSANFFCGRSQISSQTVTTATTNKSLQ